MAKKNNTKKQPDANQIAARIFEKIAGMPVAKGLYEQTVREQELEAATTPKKRRQPKAKSQQRRR